MPAHPPTLVLVGGFLGSGKTTLLVRAAAELRRGGLRPALITNDQGGALVDTRLARAADLETEEVTDGCFCCRFREFAAAAERLLACRPDVILAEPVGSCIDISATILQPLKRHYTARFRLAPFTVLADPERARELLTEDADPALAYLFRSQLAEADLVCYTRSDLHPAVPELPGGFARRLSGVTGEGVREWLSEILSGNLTPGSRLLEADYRRYAACEAELGWLNWSADLRLEDALSPAQVIGPLLDHLDRELSQASVPIVHLKVFDQAATGFLKASLCRNGEEPMVQGDLDASPAQDHDLLLNLRAHAAPEALEAAVLRAAARLPGRAAVRHCECFRPGPPVPEYRLAGGPSDARATT